MSPPPSGMMSAGTRIQFTVKSTELFSAAEEFEVKPKTKKRRLKGA